MARETTLTTSLVEENPSSWRLQNLQPAFRRIQSGLIQFSYTLLGLGFMILGWYIIALLTAGELPGPIATFQVFWDLVKEPFYDYGPNDKGIGLQLFSSLSRVFLGFLLGSLVAIPIGILMGANLFCRKT